MFRTIGGIAVVVALCCAALLCAAGCEGDTTAFQNREKFKPTAQAAEINSDYKLNPLDEGRLRLDMPKGWIKSGKRPKDYLIVLRPDRTAELPTISILKPESMPQFDSVTEENSASFLAKIKKDPQFAKFFPGKVQHGHKLIKVGKRQVVYYRVYHLGNTQMELVYLAIAEKGRRYLIELRAEEGEALEHWPALLAVVKGLSIGEKGTYAETVATEAPEPDKEEMPGFDEDDSPKKAKPKSDGPGFDES